MTNLSGRVTWPRSRFLRFCVAGTVGFIVDGGLVQLLTALTGLGPVTARVISFTVAALATWRLNRSFTFPEARGNNPWLQFLSYLSATGIGAGTNFLTYTVLVINSAFLARWPILAVLAGSAIGLVLNFTLSSRVVFVPESARTPEERRRRRLLTLAIFGLVGSVIVAGTTAKKWNPVGDETQYLSYAYNLYHHGAYSLAPPSQPLMPSADREPGYPALIVAMMAIDPALRTFSPDCFAGSSRHCNPTIYRSLQWTNAILMGLAALLTALTASRLTGSLGASIAAGGAVALNVQALSWRYTMMSDYLALALTALLVWLVVTGLEKPRPGRWLCAGLAFALLILTKAVFLYLAIGAVLTFFVVIWRRRREPEAAALRRMGAAFLLATFLPVIGWMGYNKSATGTFGITGGERMGIALSVRELYNDMTFKEWATSFLWWTRGFGDNIARAYLPASYTHRLNDNVPDGFNKLGHGRFFATRDRLMREKGLTQHAAEAAITRDMIVRILERPFKHAVTTLALFYRGIWIDEFIVLTLPALIVVLVAAWRRRNGTVALAVSPGIYSLVIYAAASLNIPRYQLTAIPALALSLGLAFAMIRAQRARRRQERPV